MVDERITAKTILPAPAGVIPRPRLIRKLTAAPRARVVLITGQAAQGKSILAAELARRPGPTCAWMSLDDADHDPANLFRLLVHALGKALPRLNVAPFLKDPPIAPDNRFGAECILEMTDKLMAACDATTPLRLIMDGIEACRDTPECLKIVERIRSTLPPYSCLILVSREIPPLKLEALRIHGELVELTNADLSFTTEETYRFFNDRHGLHIEPAQVAKIRTLTGGWAGGLVLTWEVLQHVPEDRRALFIENDLPNALRSGRLNYFAEEVLARLDERARDVVIRSSIFNTIRAQTAARCFQNDSEKEIQAVLETMVRRNLFTRSFHDSETGWAFRYNPLFRDFLTDTFNRTLNRETRRGLFLRAADAAWREGDHKQAVTFFVKAEAYDKAAAGIKKIAMQLSVQGRFADLARWVDILPDAIVKDDTWLLFCKALARRINGGRRNIQAFGKIHERFKGERDQRGQILSLAFLIEAAVFVGHPVSEIDRRLDEARSLLEAMSGNDYYPFAKTVLWMQTAFGHLSAAVDLQKGLSACRNALLLANTIGNESLTANATIIHIFGLTLAGELSTAEKALTAIDRLEEAAFPEYRALKNIVHIQLALSRENLDRAQRLLNANRKEIDAFGLLFLYPVHLDIVGQLQIRRRRFDAAAGTARHLKDVAMLAANPFYLGLALQLRALSAYHQGRFDSAGQWAHAAGEKMAERLGESVYRFRCRLIEGMANFHTGDPDAARQALAAALDHFRQAGSSLSIVEAHLALSLVERNAGNTATANQLLESALDLAAAKGYDALPLLSADDLRASCAPARASANPTIARTARRLTEGLPDDDTGPWKQTAGKDIPEHAPATGAMIVAARPLIDIRTLGGFEVRHMDGEPITGDQWSGNRQKLMLKAIVANDCRDIPKETLMDAVWPDSETAAAVGRFKITLHRLRNILEPHRTSHGRSSCISLKDNRVSLDNERCRVDVNAFLAACDTIRRHKPDEDSDAFLAACRQAADLYSGDFLPEEPYLSWVEIKRTALRERYLRVLMKMAVLWEQKYELDEAIRCCHRAIRTDPLAEHFHQRLMVLLLRQGRQSEAIKAYRTLRKRLMEELDIEPDLATKRIYREIDKLKAES